VVVLDFQLESAKAWLGDEPDLLRNDQWLSTDKEIGT
jgi:hypothetical protein